MEQVDWLDYYYEEEHIDYERYYEALDEKSDAEWEDNCDE